MARKGRPSKPGARKNGRRIPDVAVFDKGTDQAKLRRELYHGNGYDPIGRAYAVGLLGDGDEAKDRLTMGRRYAQAYHAEYAVTRYRCPIGDNVRGIDHGDNRTNERREWVDQQTARMVATGCLPYADQLLDPMNAFADQNPAWLARLLDRALSNRKLALAGRPEIPHEERDWIVLRAALRALDAILPMRREARAMSVTLAA